MNDPDPALELLARHLQNLHEAIRGIDTRLRRIEACLGLMKESGRLWPLGEAKARVVRWEPAQGGDDPDAA